VSLLQFCVRNESQPLRIPLTAGKTGKGGKGGGEFQPSTRNQMEAINKLISVRKMKFIYGIADIKTKLADANIK